MASIKEVANQFFEACEAGKGWEACKAFCKPNATFAAQAEPLADAPRRMGSAPRVDPPPARANPPRPKCHYLRP